MVLLLTSEFAYMTLNKFGEHLTGGIMSVDKFGKHIYSHGIRKHVHKVLPRKLVQVLDLWTDGREVEPGIYNITNKAGTSAYVNELFSGTIVKVVLIGSNAWLRINGKDYDPKSSTPIKLKLQDKIQIKRRHKLKSPASAAVSIVIQ